MKQVTVVILAAFLAGCYTQIQIPEKETAYVPPQPIVIIIPQPHPPRPCPQPIPHPTNPLAHPVHIQPAELTSAPPAVSDRIRTDGSTRDERTADRGGRRR